MAEPLWLDPEEVEAIQEQVLYPGERPGYLQSRGALVSALSRAQNYYLYLSVESLCDLAAIYCIAIAKGHVFQDGNKRAAVVGAAYFLAKNGIDFDPDDATPESAEMIERAACDDIEYEELGVWIAANVAA